MSKPDFHLLTQTLNAELSQLTFSQPVHTVLNPLTYAGDPYLKYIDRYLQSPRKIIYSGMNPGPYGMGQIGIPFGDIESVKNWLRIEGKVFQPLYAHPAKPILGFDSTRREVSGKRFWGLMKELYGTADDFFANNFVHNYCPLLFLDEKGRNITPDKLKKKEKDQLFPLCDKYYLDMLAWMNPEYCIGIGKFSLSYLERIIPKLPSNKVKLINIPHPSPANPRANKFWREDTLLILKQEGLIPH
ncbi:uracil-DNA glycosylase family protein [Spirochaeta cellobiosiphila]|uniref:uracil-DNA glycosylase family protein n=1 Tax=Spirochaeta cellobiosiphila TaxID=504483 RepID=UPI000562B8A1|nr:hypothetical protein [Spirochaeta cellobiosiphila]